MCAVVTSDLTGINSVVAFDGTTYDITGGTSIGSNLFHSFSDFSISSGQIAHFDNGMTIGNIFARVTGLNISNIDGVISNEFSSNVYLINPNGFLFGPNASLNLSASFYVTTADYVTLGSFGVFDANNPANDILTADNISGFGFIDSTIGDISVNGSNLSVNDYESIFINGRNIDITNNVTPATVKAPDGYVSMLSVNSPGVTDGADLSGFSSLGDISVSNGSNINIDGSGDWGQIYIRGNNFVIDNASVTANTIGNSGWGNEINIATKGKITIKNDGYISTSVSGDLSGGDIDISTTDMDILSGARIGLYNSDAGSGSDLNLQVSNVLNISGFGVEDSGIYSEVSLTGTGSGSDINLVCPNINIFDSGIINSQTKGQGSAGDLSFNSLNIYLNNFGSIQSSCKGSATGKTSDLTINTQTLTLLNDSFIDNSSFSPGNAGDTQISASGDVIVNNSILYSSVENSGNGGDLTLNANNLSLINGGQIDFSLRSSGNSGDLNINVTNNLLISGFNVNQSGIYNDLEFGSSSQAGEVNITAKNLSINDGGTISVRTYTANDGSILKLNISDTLSIDGVYDSGFDYFPSNIFGGTESSGDGGDINIFANKLDIKNGGRINCSTNGSGVGSDMVLNISDITIDGAKHFPSKSFFSNIFGGATNVGDGGDISIISDNITITNGGKIYCNTESSGEGSELNIKVKNISIDGYSIYDGNLYKSGIIGGTDSTGNGGDINIDSKDIFITNGGIIQGNTESSGLGTDIKIDSKNINVTGYSPPEYSDTEHREAGSSISSGTTDSGNSGTIEINSDYLELKDGGQIVGSSWSTGNGGSILLNIAQSLNISGSYIANYGGFDINIGSRISSGSRDLGNGGDINITVPELNLYNYGEIEAGAWDDAEETGDIILNVNNLTLNNWAFIDSSTYSKAPGGYVEINSDNLKIMDNSSIDTSGAEGSGGDIKINSSGSFILDGESDISVGTNSYGNAGDIYITSPNITISNYGTIKSSGYNNSGIDGGEAGTVLIKGENIDLTSNSYISGENSGISLGGYIQIIADKYFKINTSSYILSSSFGEKEAGKINIQAPEISIIGNSKIQANSNDDGNGGDIYLKGNYVKLQNFGYLEASAKNYGNSGSIEIDAKNLIDISSGGAIKSNAEEFSFGDSGYIRLTAPYLHIYNSGLVSASSAGAGQGGDIEIFTSKTLIESGGKIEAKSTDEGYSGAISITATDRVEMDRGEISVLSEKSDGGDINIKTNYWLKMNNSIISAEVKGGSGSGGNILIDPIYVLLFSSQIIANAYGGPGGNITIVADLFLKSLDSTITASSRLGVDGEVEILSPIVDITGSIKSLPDKMSDNTKMLPKCCSDLKAKEESTFTVLSKDSILLNPKGLLYEY